MPFKVEPLKWPKPQTYYRKGDRVEYRGGYASLVKLCAGLRGTVLADAPISIMTGVLVSWDDGVQRTVECIRVRKLNVLELLSEIE